MAPLVEAVASAPAPNAAARAPTTGPVDAEGRERFESASVAVAPTRPFTTSPASLPRFFCACGRFRALADEVLHLKLRVEGHRFARADLRVFHGCKVLHHLSERERERERLISL